MAKYTKHTDEELIALLKKDDVQAFGELHNRYYGLLYVHAYKRFPFREEVRDILQDLFLYLWHNRGNLTFSTSVPAYLHVAIRNRLFKLYRHEKVKNQYTDSLQNFMEEAVETADGFLIEKEMTLLIEREVSALPTQMRIIFELSRNQNLSHKEIAEQLGLSPHTVRTQVQRALRILRSKLGMSIIFVLF